jgi:hypothetical protein
LPHARGSQRGLSASVATANDDNIQFLREKHGKGQTEGRKSYRNLLWLANVLQSFTWNQA